MINKGAQRQVCKVKVGISYKLRYVSPNIFSISQIFSALATSRVCNWSRATCLLSGQSSRSQLRPMLACVMAADNHNHHAFTNILEFAETRNKKTMQCIGMVYDLWRYSRLPTQRKIDDLSSLPQCKSRSTVDCWPWKHMQPHDTAMLVLDTGIQSWSVTALHPTFYILDTCYQWFVFTCGHA